MKSTLNSVRVVAFNTVKEIIRDRILYGLLIFAAFLVVLGLLLGELSYAEQERIVTDFGLVAVELGCCMLAVFVGSSLVWREIEKQTVLLLISKPVTRAQFLVGKFLGLAAVLILVDILVSAFLAGMCKIFGQIHWYPFLASQLGILFESLLLLAVSIFFGVFATPALATIFTLSVWVVGHGLNDLHYFSQRSDNPAFKFFGNIASHGFPNLSYFNFKEAAVFGDPVQSLQLVKAFALWAAWSIILMTLSTMIFEKRDFI